MRKNKRIGITVKHPMRHPDCEYCNASERLSENHKHILAVAVRKIKALSLEIEQLKSNNIPSRKPSNSK